MFLSEYVVPADLVWTDTGISAGLATLAILAGAILVAIATRPRDDATRPLGIVIPPAPPPRPLDWGWALRSLRALLADPQDTEKAFEVFAAFDGSSEERTFQKLLAQPLGPRLLDERPSLIALLGNRDALGRMPAGSLGRAYLDYLERNAFDPVGLLALKARLEARLRVGREDFPRLDAAREWFRDRTILTHDLWHVLTGYGTDEMGEAALVAFTLGQVGGRANTLLIFGITIRSLAERRLRFLAYLFRAWRRGRRSAWLNALPYEELLPLPLEAARHRARIAPAAVAHPGGILSGRFAPAGGAARVA